MNNNWPYPSCKNMQEPCPIVIKGDLPLGYALRWPLYLLLHCERGYYYWVEANYLHGVGGSVEEAVEDFKWMLVEYYEMLEEERWRLAPWLWERLMWLRELLIKPQTGM